MTGRFADVFYSGLLIITVLAFGGVDAMGQLADPTRDEMVAISARALEKEFDDNPVAAKRKYEHIKLFFVDGVISSIHSGGSIYLKGTGFVGVRISFEDEDSLLSLRKNQRVDVSCRTLDHGDILGLRLGECSLAGSR